MSVYIPILVLFLAGLLGGALSFLVPHNKQAWVQTVLTFTGAYLFSFVLLHMVPHAMTTYGGQQAMLWFLLGFLLQFILQRYSHGLEHGHAHHHDHLPSREWAIIAIGLSLHALTEGLPLMDTKMSQPDFFGLIVGISIHKLPEAFALACMLSHSVGRKSLRWVWVIAFSALTPLSIGFFHGIGMDHSSFLKLFFPLVAGSLLQIATSILYESTNKQHKLNFDKILPLLIGFLAAALLA